jgi:EAL domain-containing protein (putative c-di-GMP-specific phosphodiesterase class I)
VLATACRDAAGWAGSGAGLPVSVNLSVRQLSTEGIVDDVRTALEAAGLPPSRLTLEITESVLLTDASTTIDRLRRLKDLGVRLSIDDFGTGYSALSYLRSFPLDELKVDRSFIQSMRDDPRVARLVGAIVQIGSALGLETVAEGVEHAEEAAMLRAFGCDRAQGFLFSRPVPVGDLRGLLVDRTGIEVAGPIGRVRRRAGSPEVSTAALVETA